MSHHLSITSIIRASEFPWQLSFLHFPMAALYHFHGRLSSSLSITTGSVLISLFGSRSSNPPDSGASFRHACFQGILPTYCFGVFLLRPVFRMCVLYPHFQGAHPMGLFSDVLYTSSETLFLCAFSSSAVTGIESTWWVKHHSMRAEKCKAGFLLICVTV